MTIADDQIATLRANLSGNFEEHRRLFAQLDPAGIGKGYYALVSAAFFEAVDRRFVKNGAIADDAEVVEYVASLRSRVEAIAREIDPLVAERLILHALGKGNLDGITRETRIPTQEVLLVALVAEANFTDEQLDSFIGAARALADRWISRSKD